ncbi:MAG: hypothetical protein ACPL4I_08330 [Bacteroidota bacterium]
MLPTGLGMRFSARVFIEELSKPAINLIFFALLDIFQIASGFLQKHKEQADR